MFLEPHLAESNPHLSYLPVPSWFTPNNIVCSIVKIPINRKFWMFLDVLVVMYAYGYGPLPVISTK